MQFSTRNGYGPVPDYSSYPNPDSIPIYTTDLPLLSVKLYHLLNSLTPAEEAAIRRIIPLLSLVRLSHGNIGSRGSVHCVWVQSKLGKVLPNLPEECKFIVVTRLGANGCRMNSLKFNKQKNKMFLHSLNGLITQHGVTSKSASNTLTGETMK